MLNLYRFYAIINKQGELDMKRFLKYVKDSLLTLFILALSFILSILLHELCNTPSLAPLLFVLAVFIVSLTTKGYIYGIAASMLSVLAVNYAFAFPYFKFDFLCFKIDNTLVILYSNISIR